MVTYQPVEDVTTARITQVVGEYDVWKGDLVNSPASMQDLASHSVPPGPAPLMLVPCMAAR